MINVDFQRTKVDFRPTETKDKGYAVRVTFYHLNTYGYSEVGRTYLASYNLPSMEAATEKARQKADEYVEWARNTQEETPEVWEV